MRSPFLLGSLVALSLLPCSGSLSGKGIIARDNPLLDVRYTTSGPVIDGEPSDAVWGQAVPDSAFRFLGEPDSRSPWTTIRALYDDTSLYILYTCRGKPTDNLVASTIRRDGPMWERDDEIEFFFFPGEQDTSYVQLITNPIGAKFDFQSGRFTQYKDFVWKATPSWREDRWTIEIEIPLRPFVESVKGGEIWRANFARYVRTSPDSTVLLTWGPTEDSFHEPEHFGGLRFEKSVAFRAISQEVDWTEDESSAIANLRRLRGTDIYQPLKEYFDVTLTLRNSNRPFEVLRRRVTTFLREFPDSTVSLDFALKTIYPMAAALRVHPEAVDSFAQNAETILDLRGTEKDLLALSKEMYYNQMGQREHWIRFYRDRDIRDLPLRATVCYLFLSRTKFDRFLSEEDRLLLKEALACFKDLVVAGSTPLHTQKGAIWLVSTPTRQDVTERMYEAFRRAARHIPEEVLAFSRSLQNTRNVSDESALTLRKIEFELFANRSGPFFSPQKADSLILTIAPYDEEYGRIKLYALLREKIREIDREYSRVTPGFLPTTIRDAAKLRKHYADSHPIDMALATAYEAADSLDTAVSYMDRYLEFLGKDWQESGPVARYAREIRFRREHRDDPSFFTIPRNPFRLVYRVQGFKENPSILDISSDGKAVIYPTVPDSLDPRAHRDMTVDTSVDSPAVVFSLSPEEIDSLYTLLTRSDFLRFKLRYAEPCYECGSTEITLFTPWNTRTVFLVGDDPAKPPFRLKDAVSSILDKYIQNATSWYRDWRDLSAILRLWGTYNTPGKEGEEKLDILLTLFDRESTQWLWDNEDWYIDPLLALGEETGREAEVNAAIGLKYFDSVFKWRRYWRERVPKHRTDEIIKARNYLSKASQESRSNEEAEWYAFLVRFTHSYTLDLERIAEELETLRDEGNRENARSLLLWLACARDKPDVATAQYEAMNASKASDRVKFRATLRMMLYSKDHGRPEEALDYLNRIEKKYAKFLAEEREDRIQVLDDYARIDMQLDRIDLLLRLDQTETAGNLIEEIDASKIPESRRHEYDDFLRLTKLGAIPREYKTEEIRDYVRNISALTRAHDYERSARWSMWLLENLDKPELRPQVLGSLTHTFQGREVWDDLQVEIARTILAEYREAPNWRGTDPTESLLSKVIARGGLDDVVTFWREEIRPHPLGRSRIPAMDRLVHFFTEEREYEEAGLVLDKIRKELVREGPDSSLADLISLKYSLDRAKLDVVELDRRDAGIALVDSLVTGLPQLSKESYPYAFMAIADWKARKLGWEALLKFVSPYGDSLIKVEKDLELSVYHPPFLPGTPIYSPLLALRCIQRKGPLSAGNDFFDLLGLDPDKADPELTALERSPNKLNLDCSQALLLNWMRGSFKSILGHYAHPRR